MIKVRKYHIDIKPEFFIKLIKTKQHYKNMMILLIESSKISKDYKKLLVSSKSFAYLVRNTYHKLSNIDLYNGLLNEIDKDNDLKSIYENILELYDKFSSKFLLEINKEIETSYKSTFSNLKKGNIKSFNMRTRKVSKTNKGTINIDSNIVKYKDELLLLNVFSTKYTKNNKLELYIGDKEFLNNVKIKNVELEVRLSSIWISLTYDDNKDVIIPMDNGNYLSIDPGMNNHLTLFSLYDDNNESFIIKNSSINKINNSLYRILPNINSKIDILKNNRDYGNSYKRLKYKKDYLYEKRKLILRNEIHKITNRIISYCKSKSINSIIIGFNKKQKNEVNMGKTNNKKFLSFPHELVREQLKYKCIESGINYIEQEESYTSKLSCLTDKVWNFTKGSKDTNESNGIRGITIKGKKIHSLFKDKLCNFIFHSDVNGAINIMQKYLKSYIRVLNLKTLCSPITIKNDFIALKFLS